MSVSPPQAPRQSGARPDAWRTTGLAKPRRGGLLWRLRRNRPAVLGGSITLALAVLGALAPLISRYDPVLQDISQAAQPDR